MSNLMAAAAALKINQTNNTINTALGTITKIQTQTSSCGSCNEPIHLGPCYCNGCNLKIKNCNCSNRCPTCNSLKKYCSCNMKKLQEQIKAERNTLGWTQKKLAYECGFSQGTITRAERNGWISIGCLLAITRALGKELTIASKT